jgi:hypothetical protein
LVIRGHTTRNMKPRFSSHRRPPWRRNGYHLPRRRKLPFEEKKRSSSAVEKKQPSSATEKKRPAVPRKKLAVRGEEWSAVEKRRPAAAEEKKPAVQGEKRAAVRRGEETAVVRHREEMSGRGRGEVAVVASLRRSLGSRLQLGRSLGTGAAGRRAAASSRLSFST